MPVKFNKCIDYSGEAVWQIDNSLGVITLDPKEIEKNFANNVERLYVAIQNGQSFNGFVIGNFTFFTNGNSTMIIVGELFSEDEESISDTTLVISQYYSLSILEKMLEAYASL